jgi:hypothetical protein
LYPFAHVLPGPATQTRLFIFSNTDSIIWDWVTNKIVKRLPRLPGPPRLYPLSGTSVMLPLRPEDKYAPRILICGGSAKKDAKQVADNTCGRINLSNLNTAKWEIEGFGGIPRIMPDVVILADGKTMFLNGAGKGFSGYSKCQYTYLYNIYILYSIYYIFTNNIIFQFYYYRFQKRYNIGC